jgi:hypothetical protein
LESNTWWLRWDANTPFITESTGSRVDGVVTKGTMDFDLEERDPDDVELEA